MTGPLLKPRERARSTAFVVAPGRSRRHADEHPLLELQRTAGNAATTIVVQRKTGAPLRTDKAVEAVQLALRVPQTGHWDEPTAAALRAYQEYVGLSARGSLDDATVSALVTELFVRGGEKAEEPKLAAVELVIDFYKLSRPSGTTIEYVAKDLEDGADCEPEDAKRRPIRGSSTIRLGPNAFASTAGLVHTVAHELEHARQNASPIPGLRSGRERSGLELDALEEFEGEAVEILSKGMPEESHLQFEQDAARAIEKWEAMLPEDRARLARKFKAVREKVLERLRRAGVTESPDLYERWQRAPR